MSLPYIKREIHLDDIITAYDLSYITDFGAKIVDMEDLMPGSKTHFEERQTIAMGTDSSNLGYYYPRAIINDNGMQVYPPIITAYMNKVMGQSTTAGVFTIRCETNKASMGNVTINDKTTILWPNIFKVTYSTTNPLTLAQNPSGANYTTVNVPSFDTSVQNNNQWAYFIGSQISIKDPILEKQIPEAGTIWGTSWPSAYYSYFRVDLDIHAINHKDHIEQFNTNEGIPFAYNNVNNTEVLRRTCILAGQGENAFTLTNADTAITSGTFVLPAGTSSYNILKYYFKGQLLTDLTEDLAYIMPKFSNEPSATTIYAEGSPFHYSYLSMQGTPGNQNGELPLDHVAYGGWWPTYITKYYANDPNASYFRPYSYNLPGVNGSGLFSETDTTISFNNALFNVFLIKVYGNENMFSFGQKSSYYNHKFLIGPMTFQGHISNIQITSGTGIGGPHNTPFIYKNVTNTPVFAHNALQNTLIHNSEVMSIKNYNIEHGTLGQIRPDVYKPGAASIVHRYNTYLQEGIASPFRVMTYSYAIHYNDVDHLSYNTLGDGNATLIIHMNDHPNNNYWYGLGENMTDTYAYCYIAADYLTIIGEDGIMCNRVISDTYLCIKKETVTLMGGSGGTYYRSYYTSTWNNS